MSCITRTSLILWRLRNQRSKKCMWLLNNYRFSSSSENSSNQETIKDQKKAKDVETESTPQEDKNKAAKDKLMSLLSDMASKNFVSTTGPAVKISLPKQRLKTKEEIQKQPKASPKIISAVKSVASLAGSQAEKIESELIESLQTIGRISDEAEDDVIEEVEDDVLDQEQEQVESKVSQEHIMASAVEAVAASMSGAPEEAQSELTKKLLSLTAQSGEENVETEKIKSLFKGMRVETHQATAIPESRAPAGKFVPKFSPRVEEKIDLFGDAPLGIFPVINESEKPRDCSMLWEKLQQRELKSLVTFAPTNPFQEMIQLTEQGKHWKFPIDNFSEIGPEENVGFHEHVFLEHHLHGFPKKGPIRHFMELVCTGLSKNPYITVERKIQNIDWYRQYFKDKAHILQEYGVLDDSPPVLESKSK